MRDLILAYIAALIVLGVLDFAWLHTTAGPIYHRGLGDILAEKPNMTPAVAFYLLHVVGLTYFCISPALAGGPLGDGALGDEAWRTALLRGALFGFFVYAAYDLTNLATLKIWSLKVSLIDITWGTAASAIAAAGGAAAVILMRK